MAARNPSQPEEVNPNVDAGPTEGLSTMAEMFGSPKIVDEVQQVPMPPMGEMGWVIRPTIDIEDMTVGYPDMHFNFTAGTRYRVPQRVAEILYNQDKLMEQPFRFEEARAGR